MTAIRQMLNLNQKLTPYIETTILLLEVGALPKFFLILCELVPEVHFEIKLWHMLQGRNNVVNNFLHAQGRKCYKTFSVCKLQTFVLS
jgi:hypothetical protein